MCTVYVADYLLLKQTATNLQVTALSAFWCFPGEQDYSLEEGLQEKSYCFVMLLGFFHLYIDHWVWCTKKS